MSSFRALWEGLSGIALSQSVSLGMDCGVSNVDIITADSLCLCLWIKSKLSATTPAPCLLD